jgi:hypothetical protein
MFAYAKVVSNLRTCRVSFTDTEGLTHTAQVAASSLYEAAALGIAEFRRCGMLNAASGLGTRLSVAVESPTTVHEIPVKKLAGWLETSGKSPQEQALKERLRELVGGELAV